MPAYYETGHAKNVANLQDLIAFVTGYGATYNPTKTALKLPQLNTLYTTSNNALADVVAKNRAYNDAVNARINAFAGLETLSTQIINAFEVTDATKEKIADAKSFNRKIQGKRAAKIEEPVDENTPAPKTVSASHLSYDQLIQHFEGLIAVLESEPSYAPNETALKITTLKAKKDLMTLKNKELSTAFTNITNSRIARDKTLYLAPTGLVPIAKDVKKYIKSIFKANSPEYAAVSSIEFKTIKK